MNDIDWTAFLWIWGLLRLVLFVAIAFGIKYAGKWFKAFRAEVSHHGDVCENVHGEGGLRDRVESLEAKMEVMMEALKKENIINVETKVDASKTEFHDKVDSVQTGSGDIK